MDLEAVGRDGRLLVAHLVAHRSRAVARSELAGLLDDGDAALEGPLTRLGEALDGHLATVGAGVSLLLPPEAWVDVEVAERSALAADVAFAAGDAAAAFGHAQMAVRLLALPYLPEFDTVCVSQRRRQQF